MNTQKSRVLSASIVVMLALASLPAQAAELSPEQRKCLEGVAKAGRTFVKKKMKTVQKCNNTNAQTPASCTPGDLAGSVAALEQKFRDAIAKKCAPVNIFGLLNIGYPGKCFDPVPGDGFTLADLQNCMVNSHEAIVDALIDVEYGPPTILTSTLRKCQEAVAKNGASLTVAVLKAVQKCRNEINKGNLTGFDPVDCATADPKTAQAVANAESKARAGILNKCTPGDLDTLDVCEPPPMAPPPMDDVECIIDTHRDAADTPDPTQSDLIDFEYAAPPLCGDGVRNVLEEECDRDDDGDCPGQCGAPEDDFPCLCLTTPRQRVIEHADADLDNGWSGQNHDAGIVEGGGYISDLYDCDPNMGDYDCTVGPSCSGAPHPPCSNDAQCAFFGLGPCRKTRTAVGPHCKFDVQQTCVNTSTTTQSCESDNSCPGTGNCCQKTFHGPPLPLAAGGVQVCVVNVFTEDVVGTTNLQTGAGAVRLRQRAITHLGGAPDRPCPTCGGFCNGPLGMGGAPGTRSQCSTNADCPSSQCVTALVCSYGPNADQPCRPDPPYGGTTQFFGNPSVDCPPVVGQNISNDGLDILFDPATTGTVSLAPSVECNLSAFAGERCVGGLNEGRPCMGPGDCPSGTCNEQCFCPNLGPGSQQPNACASACVSTGADDANPCTTDAHCPTGFCHPADCRHDPSDMDSVQEGRCTVGPTDGYCSVTAFKACPLSGPSPDLACRPPSDGGSCTFCQPGETCTTRRRQCFVNTGIIRAGAVGVPDRTSAAIFCIAATGAPAINTVAGLPGPGAITQPVTVVETGF